MEDGEQLCRRLFRKRRFIGYDGGGFRGKDVPKAATRPSAWKERNDTIAKNLNHPLGEGDAADGWRQGEGFALSTS
jgi:hypothetical protein